MNYCVHFTGCEAQTINVTNLVTAKSLKKISLAFNKMRMWTRLG